MAGITPRRGLPGILLVVASLGAASPIAADTLSDITVTAFRRPVSIERAGSTVTIIPRAQIERASAGSMVELFRSVPGVTVSESGGAGGEALVSLRGAEAQHTLVLIDGIRVNDPASRRNQFDFSVLSPTDIERIEILRGPQSAVYGADAIGGVINIITRKPDGKVHASATVEGGSYGTHRESASLSGGIGGLNLLASGSFFRSDGFSRVGNRDGGEADATQKMSGTLRGSYDFGGAFLDFGINGFRQETEIDKASADNSVETATRTMIDGFARLSFTTDRVDHSITGFATHTDRFYVEDRTPNPPRLYDYLGVSAGAEYQADIDLDRHGTLVAGARFEEVSAYQKRRDQAAPTFDETRLYFAGFALHSFTLFDHLHLSLGGRYDGEAGGEGFPTGRMTAVYEMIETDTRLRASFGNGAKRPTAFQLSFNPDLAMERSVGGDVGIDQTLHHGQIHLSATGFYSRIDDMIDFSGDVITGTYRNVTAAETAGLELSAEAELIRDVLSLNATYTYLYARNLGTGLALARRAPHSGRLALSWRGVDRLTVAMSALFVGPRYDDDAATEFLFGYTRVDLNAAYEATEQLTLFGRVENLLDAEYREIGDYNTAGLSAYVGLTWRH